MHFIVNRPILKGVEDRSFEARKYLITTILPHCQIDCSRTHEYLVPTLYLFTQAYPPFWISLRDSICAAIEHSYQLLYNLGYLIGFIQAFSWIKAHTHIINTNFILTNCT